MNSTKIAIVHSVHTVSKLDAYVYARKRTLPRGFEQFFSSSRTAVVSIDMHEGHLANSPDCPCPAPRAREIVKPIDQFHLACRDFGVPVIHVRTILRKGGVDDVRGMKAAWRLTFPLHVGPIPNSDESAIEGSRWTQFATEVKPQDMIVQTKKRLSVFYPTDLDFLLRNMDVRTLVLNGGFTDCCVLNAAFEGSNYGYNIVVVRDLVRGTNEEVEEAALKIISLHLGVVVDAADLLAEWKNSAKFSRAAAKQ